MMRNVLCLLLFINAAALPRLAAGAGAASGPPPGVEISSITFQGRESFETDELLDEIRTKVGDPYVEGDEDVAGRLVRSFYHRNGFLEAAAVGSTVAVPGAVSIHIQIDEGPLYRFGETRVEGLRTLPERVMKLERAYAPGDPYLRSRLFDTQSRLYATGLFEEVEITASTTSAKTAEILVRLKERRLKWIKGGVGWGSEERERLTLELLHENFSRRAFRADLTGTWSAIWREYRLDFVNPYFFETRTEQRSSVSWRKENRDGYDHERTRGEVSLGRELIPRLTGTVAARFDRNIVYDVSPAVAAFTPERSDARTIATAFNHDTSNDFFFPSRGSRTRLSLERFGGFMGGLIDMHRVTIDSTAYRPLWRQLVLAAALRSGYSQQYGRTEEVPVFERFFMGGANSLRGYDERAVGPKDANNSPLGGTRRFGSSVELRFPLFWKLRGAVFVDGGMVAAHWLGVDPDLWKWSAGGGLRLVTPVGPFRLDGGYKLNRDPGDLETWRVHFSLGEAF